MDSITHTVLGACIGEIIAGKKLGKKALLWGALANNIPDIDVVTSLWMNVPDGMLAHRGFTHSFLFTLLASPLLAWICSKIFRKQNASFRDWLLIFGSGILIHVLIDGLTAYGTGWFEPFSHYRISFNLLFVADPFYTLSLFVGAIFLFILRSSSPRRNQIAKGAIIISCLYIVYASYNKIRIDNDVCSNIESQHMPVIRYFSTPTPLNNFLWYVAIELDSGYYIGYRSVFDKNAKINFRFFSQNVSLIDSLGMSPELFKLIRFANGYYTFDKIDGLIIFNDLRFGQIGGWEDPAAPFVFRYYLSPDADNDLIIQRGRMKGSGKKAMQALWKRIGGS